MKRARSEDGGDLVTRGPFTQADLKEDAALCAQLASLKLACFSKYHRGKYSDINQLVVGDEGDERDPFYGQVYFCVEDPEKLSRRRLVSFAAIDAHGVINDVGTRRGYLRRGLASSLVSRCERFCFQRGDSHVLVDVVLEDDMPWWPAWWKNRGYTEIQAEQHMNPTWEQYAEEPQGASMYLRLQNPDKAANSEATSCRIE